MPLENNNFYEEKKTVINWKDEEEAGLVTWGQSLIAQAGLELVRFNLPLPLNSKDNRPVPPSHDFGLEGHKRPLC